MAKRRPSGDGMVRKRDDGRWEGRAVIGYDDKGLPITKNVLAKTKSECSAKLNALKDSLQIPIHDQPKPSILLGDWLDFWYQSYKKPNLRPNTQMSYERRIYQHIIPALGNTQLDKLTTNDIQQFYTKLKQSGRLLRAELYGEGLSDRTIRGIHTTLHAALDKAVTEKLLFRNPADGCRLPPAKAREMQILSPEEIQRLLIQAKEDGCFELLLLELSTGLRRGEICALQWNDLNFRTGELRVERQVHRVNGELVISPPKTKAANRSVILPAPVLAVLGEYRKNVNSRWMFPSPVKEDSPLEPATCRKRLQTILEHAGCKKVSFHTLRHTFVSTALESGMDVKTLSTLVGHVSAKTTLNIYSHITDEMRQMAAAKIDRRIGKCKPQDESASDSKSLSAQPHGTHPGTTFEPYKGSRRKAGTGCVTQINDKLWEGGTPPSGQTAKSTPATSTPAPARRVRKS